MEEHLWRCFHAGYCWPVFGCIPTSPAIACASRVGPSNPQFSGLQGSQRVATLGKMCPAVCGPTAWQRQLWKVLEHTSLPFHFSYKHLVTSSGSTALVSVATITKYYQVAQQPTGGRTQPRGGLGILASLVHTHFWSRPPELHLRSSGHAGSALPAYKRSQRQRGRKQGRDVASLSSVLYSMT